MTTVDPAELPSKKSDPYRYTDHTDFSTADSLSKVACLTMASLAHDRGDHEIAQRWKMLGLAAARDEVVAAQRDELDTMLAPKATVPAGTRLTERADDSPWANDAEYLEIADRVTTAEEVLNDTVANHPDFSERSVEVGRLRQLRDDRAQAVRQEALASGSWTETDESTRAAKASLDDKAGQLARSINLGGSS